MKIHNKIPVITQNPTGCTIGENSICSYQEKFGSKFLLSFTNELPLLRAKPNTMSILSDKAEFTISPPLAAEDIAPIMDKIIHFNNILENL